MMNMKNNQINREESGQALITAIIFLLALTFMGFGLITMGTIDVSASRNLRLAEESMVAAEEGVFMGLAWAGNTDTNFVNMATGTTVHLYSTTNGARDIYDRAQFEVVITMGGVTEAEEGEGTGKSGASSTKFVFMQIQVDSMGYVAETPQKLPWMTSGTDWLKFDITKRPQIKRSIQVMAKIKKAT